MACPRPLPPPPPPLTAPLPPPRLLLGQGYPFDTVKVRLQGSSRYAGPWSCARAIVREEGPRALMRGLSAPLLGGAVETGINYSTFALSRRLLEQRAGAPDAFAVPLAAGVAGVALSFAVGPAELIKCRMQMGAADARHRYAGPLDAARQLVRAEGAAGVFRGLGATMARECPGNAVYFSVYLSLRDRLRGGAAPADAAAPRPLAAALADAGAAIACGALAGMAMWLVVLPIDVAKTRKQTAWPGGPHDVSLARNLALLWREGGAAALWTGLAPTMIRAAPANAAQWLTWELLMQEWRRRRAEEEARY